MVRLCLEKGLQTQHVSIQDYHSDKQFAAVFAILSLIHVPKSQFTSQIKKIADLLPKEGVLFLGMLEGAKEGVFEGPKYPRFFAYYTPQELAEVLKPWFNQLDYYYTKASSGGYMLFVFQKK